MEVLKILSLVFLMIIDITLMLCFLYAYKEERKVILVILTMFILPTIYIILN